MAECSQAGNGLFPYWERNVPTLGMNLSHYGNKLAGLNGVMACSLKGQLILGKKILLDKRNT